jgi:citrate synthase
MVEMSPMQTEQTPIDRSLAHVRQFVAETTGEAPSDDEIADALRRYFVLKEIADHIEMRRSGEV